MATIFEVARKAGVSIATVSRVIHDSDLVSEKTKKRVKRAMVELRYVPNVIAQGLALKKTKTLSLILPGIAGEFWIDLIAGVEETSAKQGYYLIVSGSWERSERASAVRIALEGRVDGVILMAPELEEESILDFARSGSYVILLNRQIRATHRLGNIKSLQVDNFSGAYRVVKHLIAKHGRSRIGFISGPEKNIDSIERFNGYRKALEEEGLSLDSNLLVQGNFLYQSGSVAMKRLLKYKPDAVFAANDEMAISAMETLLAEGLSVPKEIAVVGFDDIRLARYVQPPLTTVKFPRYELGVKAAQLLIKLIESEAIDGNFREKGAQMLQTELVIRESCGCKKRDASSRQQTLFYRGQAAKR